MHRTAVVSAVYWYRGSCKYVYIGVPPAEGIWSSPSLGGTYTTYRYRCHHAVVRIDPEAFVTTAAAAEDCREIIPTTTAIINSKHYAYGVRTSCQKHEAATAAATAAAVATATAAAAAGGAVVV